MPHPFSASRRLADSVLAACVLAACAVLLPPQALSQTWPARPVTIITSTAGSTFDVVMRGVGAALSPLLGRPVVIENRTGGNFIIGAEACAKATPDGYTFCTGNATAFFINPAVYSKLPYDVARDFVPVIYIGAINSMLVAHPSLPAASMKELLDLARAKPDSVKFATAGTSSAPHLYIEYLRKARGIAFHNIPYKSFPQGFNASIAGEVDVSMYSTGAAVSMAKSGKVKLLAYTGDQRAASAPEIASVTEAGMGVSIVNTWIGVLAPTGTPSEIVQRLNTEMKKVIADPSVREKFLFAQGLELSPPSGGSPEEFGAFLRTGREKVAEIVRTVGVRLD